MLTAGPCDASWALPSGTPQNRLPGCWTSVICRGAGDPLPGLLACPSCRPGATQARSRASRAHLVSERNAFTWLKNGEGTKRSSSSSRRPQPLSCPPSASWPSAQVCFGSSCLGQMPGKPELCSDVPTSEVMSATESYVSDFRATRGHTDCQAHTLVHGRSPEHLGAWGGLTRQHCTTTWAGFPHLYLDLCADWEGLRAWRARAPG